MADEAFALSPISARAALPSEEDYDAISQAFMETSRGRWFLGEYAKRNRNSDTRMVLDAVSRIEETIAAQRQPVPPPDTGLAEALTAIRDAVDVARTAGAAAVDGLALEQNLAPIRKGARVIREIAWRLREIGADGRICDLIDSQISAIETGCGQISPEAAHAALGAAFDLIEGRVARFDDDDKAPIEAAEEAAAVSPAASDAMPADAAKTAQALSEAEDSETAMAGPADAAVAAAETEEVSAEASDNTDAAADAHDEAVLDMIALEMGAADVSDSGDLPEIDPEVQARLAAADLEVVNKPIEAISEPLRTELPKSELPGPAPVAASPPAAAMQAVPKPTLLPPIETSAAGPLDASLDRSRRNSPDNSLGSSLIARGVVRRPGASGVDPLGPIRRMSQAEKIAFFS